jgi:hypothetical protein
VPLSEVIGSQSTRPSFWVTEQDDFLLVARTREYHSRRDLSVPSLLV